MSGELSISNSEFTAPVGLDFALSFSAGDRPAGEKPGENEHLRLYAGSTGIRQYQVPKEIGNAKEENGRTIKAIVATPPARVPHRPRR